MSHKTCDFISAKITLFTAGPVPHATTINVINKNLGAQTFLFLLSFFTGSFLCLLPKYSCSIVQRGAVLYHHDLLLRLLLYLFIFLVSETHFV